MRCLEQIQDTKSPWFAAEGETSVFLVVLKVVLGDVKNSFERLKNTFKINKIGSFARVIVLNSMHKALPRLVACMIQTYN